MSAAASQRPTAAIRARIRNLSSMSASQRFAEGIVPCAARQQRRRADGKLPFTIPAECPSRSFSAPDTPVVARLLHVLLGRPRREGPPFDGRRIEAALGLLGRRVL